MKTVAIIQARMGSSRLPGKVLKQICGRTMLEHVVLRVKSCREVDQVVVATTTSILDQEIVDACKQYGVASFRGSEGDVLARYFEAAKQFKADIIVRATSDCPLFDPNVLGKMLFLFKTDLVKGHSIDYMSNIMQRTYPRGLDAEIFTLACLKKANEQARQPFEREHVTPFIYGHPEQFVLKSFTGPEDFSCNRWTVDTEDDFTLIRKIYETLYKNNTIFTTEEVLKLFEGMPELIKINSHIKQKQI